MRRLLALMLVLAPAPMADAHAMPMKRWPFPMPTADDQHTAAWITEAGEVHVFRDTSAHDQVLATVPWEGCDSSAAALAGGRLAVECYRAFPDAPVRVLDISSGHWSAISDERPIVSAMEELAPSEDDYRIAGLGTHAIQLDSLNRAGVTTRVFSLETGQLLALASGRHQTIDLDAAGGVAHICAPLRVRRYPFDNYGWIDWLPYAVAYRPPVLVTATQRLLLERCGSRAVHDLGRSESAPIVTRGYIAWADRSRLFVRDRSTGLTQHWTVPQQGNPPRLVGTERRIWLDETSTFGQPLVYYVDI